MHQRRVEARRDLATLYMCWSCELVDRNL